MKNKRPVENPVRHKCFFGMEVFVVNVSHYGIWKSETTGSVMSPRQASLNCGVNLRSCVQSLMLTAVHHDAELLQEKIDISVIFHFSSFSEHGENVPASDKILLQDLQLKNRKLC